jgi:hypothetical protein
MNYWTQNPEVLTQIGFEAKIFGSSGIVMQIINLK